MASEKGPSTLGVEGIPAKWCDLIARRQEIVRLATMLLEDARRPSVVHRSRLRL